MIVLYRTEWIESLELQSYREEHLKEQVGLSRTGLRKTSPETGQTHGKKLVLYTVDTQ